MQRKGGIKRWKRATLIMLPERSRPLCPPLLGGAALRRRHWSAAPHRAAARSPAPSPPCPLPRLGQMLDCPFCHRVLLTLETKGVHYDTAYVDLTDKPQWCAAAGRGGEGPGSGVGCYAGAWGGGRPDGYS